MGSGDEAAPVDGATAADDRSDGDESSHASDDSSPTTGETPPADEDVQNGADGPTESPSGRREVEVPQSLYKVVTVFSTLLAVLFVVSGFVVLDAAATVVNNPPASLVVQLLALAGPSVATVASYSSTIALVVGLLGLALVGAGAAVYVYGSRFRAPGMGKPKDEADEDQGDG